MLGGFLRLLYTDNEPTIATPPAVTGIICFLSHPLLVLSATDRAQSVWEGRQAPGICGFHHGLGWLFFFSRAGSWLDG